MSVQLDHTIVTARDQRAAAEFVAGTLGLRVGAPYGPFLPVETANGVKLDFLEVDADRVVPQHEQAGQINHKDGGRGLYFIDPNGHSLEVITRPYGSGE